MRRLAGFLAAILLGACASKPAVTPEYRREIEKWRHDRLTRLTAEDGWLTLVGLFWINQGVSRVGSDASSEVPLPTGLPEHTGTIALKGSEARFVPAKGIPLQAMVLHDDDQPNFNQLKLGSVSFYLIQRGERFGIRVKDAESPARKYFAGLEYFPIDPSWNVTAKLSPSPHKVKFETQVGVVQDGDSPGYLEFDRAGTHYKLDAVTEDDELFLVVRDATSGKTTYAASRFLYAKLPDAKGETRLDFNEAYNPPCVFTAYATCPLPPQQNRLATPIETGELKYKGEVVAP